MARKNIVIGVDIYPRYVRLDGYKVHNRYLATTIKELYQGFRFRIDFCCGGASQETVDRVKNILQISP